MKKNAKYMQNICAICKIYAKKCKKYARNMQEIYQKYAQNMYKICKQYARNMHKICTMCKNLAQYKYSTIPV